MEGRTRFLADDDELYRITDVEQAQAAITSGVLDPGEVTMITALLSFEFEGAQDVTWVQIQERYEEIKRLRDIVGVT